jgi:hypothetical protein
LLRPKSSRTHCSRGVGALRQLVVASASTSATGSAPGSAEDACTVGGTSAPIAGSRASNRSSSSHTEPLPPSLAEIAISIALACRSSFAEGPHANVTRDFRIVIRCHSAGKTKSRWLRHQTFLPLASISLNSKLFGGPSPRTWSVNA